jgi:hypothetical protein
LKERGKSNYLPFKGTQDFALGVAVYSMDYLKVAIGIFWLIGAIERLLRRLRSSQ